MTANDHALWRKIDWNLFKAFYEISSSGGVSRACKGLGRNQPAVSLALKRLEEQLEVRLCDRGRAGFSLTDEGQLVAEAAAKMKEIVGSIPDKLADVSEEVQGRVRVRLISNLVHPSLDLAIGSYHTRFPKVELFIDVAAWSDVSNALLQDEVDIGIAPCRFRQVELAYSLLFTEIHLPYCGPGHRLFGKTLHNPGELAGEAFVLTGADEPDELKRFRLEYGLGCNVAGMSEHLEEAKRLTILGIGICFLPQGFAEQDVLSGRLWPLLAEGAPMDIYVITNPRSRVHACRQLFIDELVRHADQEQPVTSRQGPGDLTAVLEDI